MSELAISIRDAITARASRPTSMLGWVEETIRELRERGLLREPVPPTSHTCASPRWRARSEATDAERRDIEAQDFTAYALFEFRHGGMLIEKCTADERDAAHEAARNLLHGLRSVLRDPAEPTLAEIREQVEAWTRVGPNPPNEYANGYFYALGKVLALLEPKKPEPMYKPGDFIVTGERTGKTWLVLGDDKSLCHLFVVDRSEPWKVKTLEKRWVRPATPAEIAKARGEA